MSLAHLMVEEGVELAVSADLKEIMSFLDTEVPKFFYENYGYRMGSGKGVLGSQLRLLVKPWDEASASSLAPSVGLLEVDALKEGGVKIRIPPREQWGNKEAVSFDEDGRIFSSFVFQLLNALQSRGLISLPGQLPIR